MIGWLVKRKDSGVAPEGRANLDALALAVAERIPASGKVWANPQSSAPEDGFGIDRIHEVLVVGWREVGALLDGNGAAKRGDRAALRLQDASRKAQEGGLSAAICADYARPTALREVGRQAFKQRVLHAVVGESHILEFQESSHLSVDYTSFRH